MTGSKSMSAMATASQLPAMAMASSQGMATASSKGISHGQQRAGDQATATFFKDLSAKESFYKQIHVFR